MISSREFLRNEALRELLADPLIQTAALPLVLSLIACALLGRIRAVWAALGAGVAFLAVYGAIMGLPAFPPASSTAKMFWGAIACLVVGFLIEGRFTPGLRLGALAAFCAAVFAWMAAPVLNAPSPVDFVRAIVLVLVGAAAFARLNSLSVGKNGAVFPALAILALAAAIGAVALIGASASLAQLAFAMAAAQGGYLLLNWPRPRHVFGASGMAFGAALLLLLAALTLFTQARSETLLLALPGLFADRFVPSRIASSPALSAVVFFGAACVFAGLAAGAAALLSGGLSSPTGY